MSALSSAVSSANSSPPAEPADNDDDDSKDEYDNVTIVEEFIPLRSSNLTPPRHYSLPATSQPSSFPTMASASPTSRPVTVVEEYIPQRHFKQTDPPLPTSTSSSLPASASPSPSLSVHSSYQSSAAASPSPSPSPPTPLALSDADDGGVSFSTLSSSISSLQTAIQRLSARLEQPQPVYIIQPVNTPRTTQPPTTATTTTTAAPPTQHSRQQPLHRPTRLSRHSQSRHSTDVSDSWSSDESCESPLSPVERVRRGRRHRPLSSRMYAVIDEQRRMMNEMMQVLHVQSYDLPCNHSVSTHPGAQLPTATRSPRSTVRLSPSSPPARRHSGIRGVSGDDDERIEEVELDEHMLPRRLANQHSRSPQRHTSRRTAAAAARPPSDSPTHSTTHHHHRTSSDHTHSPHSHSPPPPRLPLRHSTVPPSDSSLTVPSRRPPRVHPPLSHTLQAEMERMKLQADKWKQRAKTTRTQQMREQAIERRRQEEAEESRRRAEEEAVEQRKRQLVERAMVERWGVRGRRAVRPPTSTRAHNDITQPTLSHQPTARIEWIRKRDGLSSSTAHEQAQYGASGRGSSGGVKGGRDGQRRVDGGALADNEQVDEWRYEDDRKRLYSVEYLRSLGYDVVVSNEEEEADARDVQRWSNSNGVNGTAYA